MTKFRALAAAHRTVRFMRLCGGDDASRMARCPGGTEVDVKLKFRSLTSGFGVDEMTDGRGRAYSASGQGSGKENGH